MFEEDFIEITTPRLVLRNIVPDFAAALHESKEESHEALYPWMLFAKERSTLEATRAYTIEAHERFKRREDITMLGFERETGGMVVSTGLHRMDWDKGTFEIGYWVRTSALKMGIATESTNALLRYAFNRFAATKVEICHASGNDRSRRVIEKCGFTPTRVEHDAETMNDGRLVDRHWYARHDIAGLPDLKVTWR